MGLDEREVREQCSTASDSLATNKIRVESVPVEAYEADKSFSSDFIPKEHSNEAVIKRIFL